MKQSLDITKADVRKFQKHVLNFYQTQEKNYPWRQTYNPYHILISELMLQQTQTDRVISKFNSFIEKFPTVHELAKTETPHLLREWKGLGYNRRALYLQRAAQEIVSKFDGAVPADPEILITLPGIGKYTSKAISVFAFNQPEILLETNIRTVYIHHFFPGSHKISDNKIEPVVEQTLYKKSPRTWYSAVMDYGSCLKKQLKNINERSNSYKKQSPFKGSDREIRGKVLEELLKHGSVSGSEMERNVCTDRKRLYRILSDLHKEGFVQEKNETYYLKKKRKY
ncbi:MAG: A/G-specific adenine glycosylase [bacterium]